jgi:ornithine cyclodeaminase
MPPAPSELAFIPFVSVENMMRFVHHTGIERVLLELTDAIEDDFRRWALFEKIPRLASHSRDGVIELMPTTDGEVFSFKYVNGPRVIRPRASRRSQPSGCSRASKTAIRSCSPK